MSILDDDLDIDYDALVINGLKRLLNPNIDTSESYQSYMEERLSSIDNFVGFKYSEDLRVFIEYPKDLDPDEKVFIGYDYLNTKKINGTCRVKFKLFKELNIDHILPTNTRINLPSIREAVYKRNSLTEYCNGYKICTGYRQLSKNGLAYIDYGYLTITLNEIVNGKLNTTHI